MSQQDRRDQEIQQRQIQVETRVMPRGSYDERQENGATLNNVAQAFNMLQQLQQQANRNNQ